MPYFPRFHRLAGLFLALALPAGCVSATPDDKPDKNDSAAVDSLAGAQDAALDGAISPEAYAGTAPPAPALTALETSGAVTPVAPRSAALDALIARYAAIYGVPERLVRRVVDRESDFNPAARNRIYWGLMQIRHDTARTMGYRGPASGLLDAETNLKYAVKYLRGAYITAGGDEDLAVRYYASGYYYDAKRKGLLEETGLRG